MKYFEEPEITPEQLAKVMAALSKRRTAAQRKGGRPRGFKVSQETKDKTSATKRRERS